MIESLIKWYSCPSCSGNTISEQNIDIVWAAGNTVNIDMKCPWCSKHYMARMEIVGVNLSDASKFSQGNIKNMKIGMDAIKNALNEIKEKKEEDIEIQLLEESIKDDQIIDLSKNLKSKKMSVKDLFDE